MSSLADLSFMVMNLKWVRRENLNFKIRTGQHKLFENQCTV